MIFNSPLQQQFFDCRPGNLHYHFYVDDPRDLKAFGQVKFDAYFNGYRHILRCLLALQLVG
jgi:hypothetical protein